MNPNSGPRAPRLRAGLALLAALAACATPPPATPPPATPAKLAALPALSLQPRTVSRPDAQPRPAAIRLLERTRFTLNVQDADLPGLLLGLSKQSPFNVVVGSDVSGRVSADLRDVSLMAILEEVVVPRGYAYETRGNRLQVFRPKVETRVYRIDYPSYSREATSDLSVTGFIGSAPSIVDDAGTQGADDSSLSSVVTTQQQNFWGDLETQLRSIVLGTDGEEQATPTEATGAASLQRSVIVSPLAGLITINAEPDVLERVEAYLNAVAASLDRQVLIDAQIVEVTLGDDLDLGLDFEFAPDLGSTAAGIFSRMILPGQREATIVQGLAPILEDGGISFGFARNDFGLILRALATQTDVRVLSTPRITTLNNHKALIKIVRNEVFFIAEVKTEVVANVGTSQTVEFVPKVTPVGVTLDVTPQISKDSRVTLHVRPSVSEIVSIEPQPQIDPGLAGVGTLPVIDLREVDTVLRVDDGQTVVIGGLVQSREFERKRRVPLLGDIPLLGKVFTNTKTEERRTELLIFLRPVVLDAPTLSRLDGNLRRSLDEMEDLFHERSLSFPWWRHPMGRSYGARP